MKFFRQHRAPIAWGLYISVLLSVLVCGVHHGQTAAWQLQGLTGAFCTTAKIDGFKQSLGFADNSPQTTEVDCPICGSGALVLASALFWLLGFAAILRVRRPRILHVLSPRDDWPPANPRAP